ncbi:hypothetical protein AG1IA_10301 [Rhizoctonia solani AG-1 IA]|uniref:Uncharacterized protein n=1 Tax=Thanatephorus cucumeris (strain AG1-IA) TaxID=983506 RepID=L8WH04_THACA|nr:hypothetical protein AG1IA_10301 [Rhizoctonia solani AG-1 IA]
MNTATTIEISKPGNRRNPDKGMRNNGGQGMEDGKADLKMSLRLASGAASAGERHTSKSILSGPRNYLQRGVLGGVGCVEFGIVEELDIVPENVCLAVG